MKCSGMICNYQNALYECVMVGMSPVGETLRELLELNIVRQVDKQQVQF